MAGRPLIGDGCAVCRAVIPIRSREVKRSGGWGTTRRVSGREAGGEARRPSTALLRRAVPFTTSRRRDELHLNLPFQINNGLAADVDAVAIEYAVERAAAS
jgi:hypothetical protein